MPAPQDDNPKKKTVYIVRKTDGKPTIEPDWNLSRIEPESGNAIVERNGKSLVVDRKTYEALNFPAADDVWVALNDPHNDDDIVAARTSWAKLDLAGTVSSLIRHARKLDPVLCGIQTYDDLEIKIDEIANTCVRSMDIMRLEMRRAEDEYNRCPSRTGFDNDQKDTLLARLRRLEAEFATRRYRCEILIPEWQKIAAAIKALNEAAKNAK